MKTRHCCINSFWNNGLWCIHLYKTKQCFLKSSFPLWEILALFSWVLASLKRPHLIGQGHKATSNEKKNRALDYPDLFLTWTQSHSRQSVILGLSESWDKQEPITGLKILASCNSDKLYAHLILITDHSNFFLTHIYLYVCPYIKLQAVCVVCVLCVQCMCLLYVCVYTHVHICLYYLPFLCIMVST